MSSSKVSANHLAAQLARERGRKGMPRPRQRDPRYCPGLRTPSSLSGGSITVLLSCRNQEPLFTIGNHQKICFDSTETRDLCPCSHYQHQLPLYSPLPLLTVFLYADIQGHSIQGFRMRLLAVDGESPRRLIAQSGHEPRPDVACLEISREKIALQRYLPGFV